MNRSASLRALSRLRHGYERTSLAVVRVTTKLRTPRVGLRGAMVTEGAAVLLLLFVVFMFFYFVAGFFALSPKSAAGAGGPWEWSSEGTTCSGPRDIAAR